MFGYYLSNHKIYYTSSTLFGKVEKQLVLSGKRKPHRRSKESRTGEQLSRRVEEGGKEYRILRLLRFHSGQVRSGQVSNKEGQITVVNEV
jgi:hypothetical protein